MKGTYIREPDGANLLRYSRELWNDPTMGLRSSPESFRIVHSHEWDEDVKNEAQYLAPGEWLVIDGPLTIVGG